MPREYVPIPIEYLAEMEPLSDENFGRLIRALLRYGSDGTPIDLDGDCRFYAVRVMNKDDHYAARAEEEEDGDPVIEDPVVIQDVDAGDYDELAPAAEV